MQIRTPKLLPHHQATLDRFVAACQADSRVVAAFLSGSYASGRADRFSDLDLYVVVSDDAYDEFNAQRAGFLRQMGEPVFIEDFDIPGMVFFIFADDTEGELVIRRESDYARLYGGPPIVLLDKQGILAGAQFAPAEPNPAQQVEKLRRQIYWFWHDLSHFITAMRRSQLWWAQGQLEVLRHYCVNLARLRNNLADPGAGDEPYFKIEQAVPPGQLSPLQNTFCPIEKDALLEAALRILAFYQELAAALAQAHAIPYPEALERVMLQRLEGLRAGA